MKSIRFSLKKEKLSQVQDYVMLKPCVSFHMYLSETETFVLECTCDDTTFFMMGIEIGKIINS